MPKRILRTGGAGCLVSRLCDEVLMQGYQALILHALARLPQCPAFTLARSALFVAAAPQA